MLWSPNRHDENDNENDSLFGSPPPSPGRSPSPGLALPGSDSNASGNIVSALTKNVGTIALPGSQSNSEYLNPLASSLSVPSSSTVNPLPSSRYSDGSPSLPPTPSSSTSLLPQARISKGPPRPRKRKQKSTESTPRAEVQIPLPDPSEPPPPNFLRSQTALLGAAGLVAGVKPSNLVHRARGATPSNPIVIEEEFPERKAPPPPPPPKKLPPPSLERIRDCLDKPGLTMPSKQEIMACLVKEKDVFPIIQSLIRLTAPSALRPPELNPSLKWGEEEMAKRGPRTQVVGTHVTGYPMKKRKLNRVPAGAADWDIPYPFARGEGPSEYQETWQGERGKQLIEQLINLIKNATKKAAMQNYLKRHGKAKKGKAKEDDRHKRAVDDGPRVNKYYKAITATYGLPPSRQSTPAQDSDASNNVSRSVTPSTAQAPSSSSAATTPAPEQTQESSSLDLLLASLFSMAQPSSNQSPRNSTDTSSTSSTGGQFAGLGMDQSWLDDWMKSFDPTGEMNIDGSLAQHVTGDASQTTTSALDLDFSNFDFSSFSAPNTATPNATTFDMAGLPTPTDQICSTDLFPIDPQLLALSAGMNVDGSVQAPAAPSLPIPEVTSSTDTVAMAPLSTDWDMSIFSNVFAPGFAATGDGVPAAAADEANKLSSMDDGQGGGDAWESLLGKETHVDEGVMVVEPAEKEIPVELLAVVPTTDLDGTSIPATTAPPAAESAPEAQPLEQNATPSVMLESATLSIPPIINPAAEPQVPEQNKPAESTLESAPSSVSAAPRVASKACDAPKPPTTKPSLVSEREELIKRAKERKALLEVELNKVKLQLWEATIEQGGLHHVLGHYQEQEKGLLK